MNPGFPQHCVFTPAYTGTQASILSSSPTAPENEKNGKLESQHSVKHPSFYGSSISLCWRMGESRSSSTRAVGSHPLLLLPRELQQRNWLFIPPLVVSTSSLVKHAENVTSSAMRPIEPFHRSLRNFLLYFNRRQAHRKNSSSHTSGNSSSKNTY